MAYTDLNDEQIDVLKKIFKGHRKALVREAGLNEDQAYALLHATFYVDGGKSVFEGDGNFAKNFKDILPKDIGGAEDQGDAAEAKLNSAQEIITNVLNEFDATIFSNTFTDANVDEPEIEDAKELLQMGYHAEIKNKLAKKYQSVANILDNKFNAEDAQLMKNRLYDWVVTANADEDSQMLDNLGEFPSSSDYDRLDCWQQLWSELGADDHVARDKEGNNDLDEDSPEVRELSSALRDLVEFHDRAANIVTDPVGNADTLEDLELTDDLLTMASRVQRGKDIKVAAADEAKKTHRAPDDADKAAEAQKLAAELEDMSPHYIDALKEEKRAERKLQSAKDELDELNKRKAELEEKHGVAERKSNAGTILLSGIVLTIVAVICAAFAGPAAAGIIAAIGVTGTVAATGVNIARTGRDGGMKTVDLLTKKENQELNDLINDISDAKSSEKTAQINLDEARGDLADLAQQRMAKIARLNSVDSKMAEIYMGDDSKIKPPSTPGMNNLGGGMQI